MYHPQIDMFPWCSSMQFVKLLVAREQLGPHWSFWGCCAACGEAWAGSEEPPPPNMPPIAWPMDEPTATPLHALSVSNRSFRPESHICLSAFREWPNRGHAAHSRLFRAYIMKC